MKNIGLLIVAIFLVSVVAWSDEDYFGLSNMPWNTEPEEVVSVLGLPDYIMTDENDIVWLNKNYFRERYNGLSEKLEIDTRKTINAIISEYPNIQFIFYDKKFGTFPATMTISFENRFASREKYNIDIEDISLSEKNKYYNLFKNEFQKKYGTPKSVSENNIFKTLKWEIYYTNIEIQLYLASSGRGDYLRINYERSGVSKNQAGLGLDIVDTSKLGAGITTNNQFTSLIEGFKERYQKRGLEVGDLVPNAKENDPLTIGVNHILNTTNHNINELWSTRIYYEKIETWVFVYVWFTNTSPSGYNIRGIILPYAGTNLQ